MWHILLSLPFSCLLYNMSCVPSTLIIIKRMKRSSMAGLFQQLQRENTRLKDQLVAVRRELNAFENKLMLQLATVDPAKVIYDSPMLCLEAFLNHLASFSQNQQERDTALARAQHGLLLAQQRTRQAEQDADILRRRSGELQSLLREAEERGRVSVQALESAHRMGQQKQDQLQAKMREAQNKEEARRVAMEEERRVTLAAALYQSKKEMLQLREELQEQFLAESVRLRDEVKEKDEKIRSLIKGLLKYDKGERVSGAEIAQMRELVAYVGSVQQLNTQLGQAKDQIFQSKREMKEVLNKKSATELKNSQLRNQISNLLLKGEKREQEKVGLQKRIDQLQADLSAQKDSSKRLEHYYQGKWHAQFQCVKSHLERAYDDKVEDHAKELQAKKAEVSAKIQSYLFLHAQDQKIIQDLKKRIEKLTKDFESKTLLLGHQREQTAQLRKAIVETDHMMKEERASVVYAWSLKLRAKEEQVRRLQNAISNSSLDMQSLQRAAERLSVSLKESFTLEKQQLQEEYQRQQQELAMAQEGRLQNERQRYQEMLMKMRRSMEQARDQHEKALKEQRNRHVQDIKKMHALLQRQRGDAAQAAVGAQGRQKVLKKEVNDLKQYYMKKIYDLQREIQNKKASLRVVASKSDNDQQLKKQLRQMIEERTMECRQLQKIKQDLQDELQAKKSELHHLNHENTGLRMSKDDWLQVIVQVQDEFMKELAELKKNHHRQVDLLRSRLWQLENIISRRPIRIQDEKRIRCLSEQKKQLENKIDIKEAENIVLKQIKNYYEKRIEGHTPPTPNPGSTHSQGQFPSHNHHQQMAATHAHLSNHQSIKPHTLLIPKRPKRPYLQPRGNDDEEGDTADDIRKMKKYLQRFSAVDNEDRQGRAKPIRPSSRNIANRSMES